MEQISWNDFEKVEIRVGTILQANEFVGARKPAFKLLIDFGGEIGLKRSSAQITTHYECSALVGKQVVAVLNFPVKQIGNFFSEVLVLGGVLEDQSVLLLTADKPIPNGTRIA